MIAVVILSNANCCIITFRNKNKHVVLKCQLKLSTENLKTIIEKIVFLLNHQLHNYLIAFDEIKFCYFIYFRKKIFNQIDAHIIPHMIKKILLIQYIN